MKPLFFIITFVLSLSCVSAVNWEWVVSHGAGDLDRVWDMALDNQGNIYVTGEFVDTLQIGNAVITGWGLSDIFVAKFSPDGTPIWAKAFGGIGGDTALSIDTDNTGNSYITGYYTDTANFETQQLTSSGGWDIFVLKLDPNGNKVWANSEGGILNDIGYGLAVRQDGTCFVTGWFADTLVFHDNTTLTSYGGSDIFTFACANDGTLLWKRHAGTPSVEYGYKIDVDYYGNSYITGAAGFGSNFDGITLQSNGAFIASYDLNGTIRWVNCGANAGVNSIAVDRAPALIEQFGCLTGRITGTAIFGDQTLSSVNGSDDAYEAVFQLLTGSWTNAVIGGGTGSDKGRACTYKIHPYYTGSFEDSANLFGFDVTASGASDGYVHSAGYNADNWFMTAGGTNNDTPVDIAVDNAGNVYICGWYSGLARFGSTLMIDSGNDSDLDFFVAKINTTTSADDMITQPKPNLLSCYPNPFRDRLSISYEHSHAKAEQPQSVNIYNLKGKKVRSLQLAHLGGNTLSAEWDGFNSKGMKSPAGVYFIKAPEQRAKAQKVILLN